MKRNVVGYVHMEHHFVSKWRWNSSFRIWHMPGGESILIVEGSTCICTMSQNTCQDLKIWQVFLFHMPNSSLILIRSQNWINLILKRNCGRPTAALISSASSGGRSCTEFWKWSHSWHMNSNLLSVLSKTLLKRKAQKCSLL